MLAARAQHVSDVIAPALDAGTDVVCDRFSGSTVAYQGYGRGLDPDDLARMSSWASVGIEPDVVVLLRVAADVTESRRAARGSGDRIEGEGGDFVSRVAGGFESQARADPRRWRVVDGTGTVDEVAARVWEAVADGS